MSGIGRYGVSPLFTCQQAQRLGVCSDDDDGDADAVTAAFTALCTKNGLDENNTPTDTFKKWNASAGSHLSAVCAVMGGLCRCVWFAAAFVFNVSVAVFICFIVSNLTNVGLIPSGLLGQEVIKVISGQNRTCDNWLFLDGRTGSCLRACVRACVKFFLLRRGG